MRNAAGSPHASRRPALLALCGLGVLLAPPTADAQTLPPDEAGAMERLNASPRHGEWVTYDAGAGDRVSAWVVHPERPDPAPVVIVIHEIYGLTDWIRGVADQLAADGFIAVAPDLLTGHGPGGGGTASLGDRDAVVQAIRGLERSDVNRRLRAAAAWGMALPSAADRVGVVGWCWGGSSSFALATAYPDLDAAVVYYGGSPEDGFADIRAPVLGLYGGDDERVNATIPNARQAMDALGKTYEVEIYEGAGHGFLRAQEGREGANMAATRGAWPATVSFFRRYLER